MTVYALESDGRGGAKYGDRTITAKIMSAIPKELANRNFKARLFRGKKEYVSSYGREKLEDCVRLGGFRRFAARIDGNQQIIVKTYGIDEDYLKADKTKDNGWGDQVWTLVPEVGDIGDEDGIWLQTGSVGAYAGSGIEVTIRAEGAPRRQVFAVDALYASVLTPSGGQAGGGAHKAKPGGERGDERSGGTAPLLNAIYLFGTTVCYEAQKPAEMRGNSGLVIARAQTCVGSPPRVPPLTVY